MPTPTSQQPVLQTERLTLRPFVLDDASAVQFLAGEFAIADVTLNVPHPYEDGMAEEWIASQAASFAEGKLANFAIATRDPEENLVGAIGLVLTKQFDRGDLGYWIGQPFWNLGYCTEAATAVLEYAFTVGGLNRIQAIHFARNPASGRIMEKIGMTREGISRQHAKKWCIYEDVVRYGIVREEWVERRQKVTPE